MHRCINVILYDVNTLIDTDYIMFYTLIDTDYIMIYTLLVTQCFLSSLQLHGLREY